MSAEPVRIAVIIDGDEVRVCTFGVPVEALLIDYTQPTRWHGPVTLPGSEHPFCSPHENIAGVGFWEAEQFGPEEIQLLEPLFEEVRRG